MNLDTFKSIAQLSNNSKKKQKNSRKTKTEAEHNFQKLLLNQ